MVELHAEGWGVRRIGRELHRSHKTVRRWLEPQRCYDLGIDLFAAGRIDEARAVAALTDDTVLAHDVDVLNAAQEQYDRQREQADKERRALLQEPAVQDLLIARYPMLRNVSRPEASEPNAKQWSNRVSQRP